MPDAIDRVPLVELNDLRVFLVCAEELHFGRAASRLGLDASRVSRSIAMLERRLGARMFDRTSRRVALTAEGVRLRDAVGPRYRHLMATLDEVTGQATTETLRVGFFGLSGGARLTELVERFQRRHPTRLIDLVDLTVPDPFAALRRGEVDLLTSWLPVSGHGLVVGPELLRDARAVAVADEHLLAARAAVTWSDVADFRVAAIEGLPPVLLETIIPARTPAGRPLERAVTIRTMAEVFAAVARGRIVHPTTVSAAKFFGHPGISFVPMPEAEPLRSAFVRLDRTMGPVASEFLEFASGM